MYHERCCHEWMRLWIRSGIVLSRTAGTSIIMLRQAGWNSGRLHALHGDWRNLVLMWRLDGMSSMLIPEWASRNPRHSMLRGCAPLSRVGTLSTLRPCREGSRGLWARWPAVMGRPLRFATTSMRWTSKAVRQHIARCARDSVRSTPARPTRVGDGHAAIGLGLAEVLVGLRDCLSGTVKLIFQPAEEGVRGAKAMVAAGVVEGVDALLGLHLYSGWPTGRVVPGKGGFLATSKFDAYFTGAPAHAGGAPQLGRNAMLAAATAVLNLHAIPRHADGVTRINVGRLIAGQGRNVIAPTAYLAIETRGATSGSTTTWLRHPIACCGHRLRCMTVSWTFDRWAKPECGQRC